MTNLELILTNLGEVAAVEFHKNNDSSNIEELKDDMNKAGGVINKAKTEIENELHRTIVTDENYIDLESNS